MNFKNLYEKILLRLNEKIENESLIDEDEVEKNEEGIEEYMGVSALGGGPVTPLGTKSYGKVGKPSDWLKKNRTH